MDILKKMFQSEFEKHQEQDASASASNKDEFRKPQWFEEAETDDELFDDDRKFAFQVFTSPMEMQKHFECQLQRLLESMNDNDADSGFERNLREDFLKPGFESKILKEFHKKENALDTDLDGEIYPDQLHSLIQALNPEQQQQGHENILPSNQRGNKKNQPRLKLTDEELIMGRIHGTLNVDGELKPGVLRPSRPPPSGKPNIMTPMTPFGGVFDGSSYQGPKMFSQSVMTKTVRKPDGSYETTKVTQDSSGQKTTTVTRSVNGKTETVVTQEGGGNGGGGGGGQSKRAPIIGAGAATGADLGSGVALVVRQAYANRILYVTKEGYAMPRNLW